MVKMDDSLDKSHVITILEKVVDPEIPVLTIADLGMLKKVEIVSDNKIIVTITPTYSGCPAMDMISDNIKKTLTDNGYSNIEIKTILVPAWTTDWMTDEAKMKLEKYGIAPPIEKTTDKSFLLGKHKMIPCPQCKSTNTTLVSQFGSTACKALYKCTDCKEPFDYFKCH